MSADNLQAAVRVMVVDDNPDRAQLVEEKLWAAGYEVVSIIPSATGLLFQVEQHSPDIVLIDLESPDRDVLESLAVVNHHNPRPVVMFTEEDDPDYINQAVSAGISTYLVGNIDPERVKPLIDVAIAQFKSFQSLRDQLVDTRQEMEDRKLVEQAKGLLMAYQKMSEADAHKKLNKLAMDNNQRLVDVARTVLATLSPQSADDPSNPKKRGR